MEGPAEATEAVAAAMVVALEVEGQLAAEDQAVGEMEGAAAVEQAAEGRPAAHLREDRDRAPFPGARR